MSKPANSWEIRLQLGTSSTGLTKALASKCGRSCLLKSSCRYRDVEKCSGQERHVAGFFSQVRTLPRNTSMKANLCLHCGANAVNREQVSAVVTPERTDTWVPVSHDRLLTGVQQSLERSGLHVVSE